MTLGDWVATTGKTPEERVRLRERIAKACGCGEGNVRHWCNGTRPIPAKYALTVQTETGGKVKVADILQAAA